MPSTITVRRLLLGCSLVLIAIASVSCGKKAKEGAHTLVLKDGTMLRGALISRTDAGVKFETGGEVREIPMDQVHSLTLKEGEKPVYLAGGAGSTPETEKPAAEQSRTASPPQSTGSAQQASAAAPAKPAPPEPKPVTVATGTKLLLRTKENLSTATHKTG